MNESAVPRDDAPARRLRPGGLLLLLSIAVVGLILLAVFYYGVLNPSSRRVGSGAAPDFTFTAYSFGLSAYDGQTFRLSDFRGQPVVLNFWASWCAPCRDEQPHLEAAWRRYQGRVMFIGLDYLDQEPNARAYLTEFGVTYPNGPDRGSRAYTAYHVQGVPETFFIDAQGFVQGYYVGPIPAAELEQRIQALLQASTP